MHLFVCMIVGSLSITWHRLTIQCICPWGHQAAGFDSWCDVFMLVLILFWYFWIYFTTTVDVLIVLELIVTFEAGGMGTESSTGCRFMRVMQAKPAPPKSTSHPRRVFNLVVCRFCDLRILRLASVGIMLDCGMCRMRGECHSHLWCRRRRPFWVEINKGHQGNQWNQWVMYKSCNLRQEHNRTHTHIYIYTYYIYILYIHYHIYIYIIYNHIYNHIYICILSYIYMYIIIYIYTVKPMPVPHVIHSWWSNHP